MNPYDIRKKIANRGPCGNGCPWPWCIQDDGECENNCDEDNCIGVRFTAEEKQTAKEFRSTLQKEIT